MRTEKVGLTIDEQKLFEDSVGHIRSLIHFSTILFSPSPTGKTIVVVYFHPTDPDPVLNM